MSFYKDKVCVVTGAAGGIGKGIATELAKRGSKVVLVDILGDLLQETLGEIKALGDVDIVGYQMDVTVEEDWPKLRDFTLETYKRCDILFNNAGIMYAKGAGNYTSIDWLYFFKANVMSAVFGCNTFAPVMKAQGGGHISTTGSTASLGPNGGDGIADPYSPTKAAVLTYMEQFAVQQQMDKTNITCSCIMPCVIKSDLGMRLDFPGYLPKEFEPYHDIIDTRTEESKQASRDLCAAFRLPKGHPVYEQFRQMGIIDVEDGVAIILEEIEKGYFYIYTHPHMSFNVNVVEMMRRLTPWSQPVSIADAINDITTTSRWLT